MNVEKSIHLQPTETDLHLEIGDQISKEMEMDDGWQGMCVCFSVGVPVPVCICVFWWVAVWPEGWLNGEITTLLGNRGGGMGGRFSFLRGGPQIIPKEPWDYNTEIEPGDYRDEMYCGNFHNARWGTEDCGSLNNSPSCFPSFHKTFQSAS